MLPKIAANSPAGYCYYQAVPGYCYYRVAANS
jgi:hypothetical protein